jgi:hypothetical protein
MKMICTGRNTANKWSEDGKEGKLIVAIGNEKERQLNSN